MEKAQPGREAKPGDVQPATVGGTPSGAPLRAAVLAGHLGDAGGAERLTADADPAVRAAAYGALGRMGALRPDTLRAAALSDPHPSVRRRACLLAGQLVAPRAESANDTHETGDTGGSHETGDTHDTDGPDNADEVVALLTAAAVDDSDASVVEVAAWALGEAGSRCGPEAVRALVAPGRHDDALCRESAVAALGAIGDPAGFDTVLAALDDKAPVRRRAAVALAAFDDPRADDALRRCLADRDWQVRQIAEDLLEGGEAEGEG